MQSEDEFAARQRLQQENEELKREIARDRLESEK
jgi:hypothetical protein